MLAPRGLRRIAAASTVASAALVLPMLAGALEPRFDHRDQQGPTAEVFLAKDVLWRGSTSATSAGRGAVRLAWAFDPTGDGDEVQLGGTVTALDGGPADGDSVRWTLEARYRVLGGTEELKTLFDIGVWGSGDDRFVAGPLVGIGLIYDFTRNIGVLGSGFFGAAVGEGRVISFGGGVGVHYRFE